MNQQQLRFGNLLVSAGTDRGLMREENEDAFGLPHSEPALWQTHGYIFAIADGVGGYGNGREASDLTIETLYTAYYDSHPPDLLGAIQQANMTVRRRMLTMTNHNRRMGSTLVALLFHGGEVQVAHIGDSRAYLVRQGAIRQLTVDHSLVQEQLEAGLIDVEHARSHQKKNIITRAMGAESHVAADLNRFAELLTGDTFLLCSDGLTNHVSDEVIADIISKYLPEEATKKLIQIANDHGGSDNITVAVIYCDVNIASFLSSPTVNTKIQTFIPVLLWSLLLLSLGFITGYAIFWFYAR
jgi:protein phosphatase